MVRGPQSAVRSRDFILTCCTTSTGENGQRCSKQDGGGETVDEKERKEGGFTRVSAKNNTRKRFVGTKSLVGKKSDTLASIFVAQQ